MLVKNIIKKIMKIGFDEFREIKTNEILFDKNILSQCSLNTCGMYGKNHSCPPLLEAEEDIKNRILNYKYALIINKIIQISSYENIFEIPKQFDELINKLRLELIYHDILILGAGPCNYCIKCSATTGNPCLFPNKIRYSIEGSGINIMQMSINKKLTYNAGNGKVAFFGLILHN